jgi:integrase/recombinase XerC
MPNSSLRRLSLGLAKSRFMAHCRVSRGLSPNTLRAYAGDLADFLGFLRRMPLLTLQDPESVQRYLTHLKDRRRLKHSTIRRRVATLKVFCRWLEFEQLIVSSPFRALAVELRVPKQLPRAVSETDMRQLLKGARATALRRGRGAIYDSWLRYFVVVLLFTTGLRVGEVAAAKLEDLSIEERALRVCGKGNRERRVFIPRGHAAYVLERYVDLRYRRKTTADSLLVDALGKPMSPAQLRQLLHVTVRRAGIERRITPHMLRHTAATQLLRAGVDIRFVQRLLGHASITTTELYTHVSNQSLRDRLDKADTLGRVG